MCNDQGGRDILVNVCKNIATKVQNEQIKLTEIDQNLVDTHVLGKLRKIFKIFYLKFKKEFNSKRNFGYCRASNGN